MVDWIKKVFNKKEKNKGIFDVKNIAKLYKLATTDTKTQLYNYRHFNSVLKHEMAVAKRYNRNISLLILDLDDFKKINDQHGYLRGDEVLQMVAMIIKSNIRETDIAGRFGGEEFVVLMSETNITNAKEMAERLRRYVMEDKFLASYNITASIGVSSNIKIQPQVKVQSAYETFMPKQKDETNNLSLFEKANIALRYAKETGKNRSVVYDEIKRKSFLNKLGRQFR
jgi:diguanylate cyclase (GGDEF)-like protein